MTKKKLKESFLLIGQKAKVFNKKELWARRRRIWDSLEEEETCQRK
jgi:hypothetical protein